MLTNTLRAGAAAAIVAGLSLVPTAAGHPGEKERGATRTPIRHVVVIFQENVSYDHYFGTYPQASNTDGQPFQARTSTPANENLLFPQNLLTSNPNAALPQRLDSTPTGKPGGPGGQLTCDQDHEYTDEQTAVDNGKNDRYVESVGAARGTAPGTTTKCDPKAVMDYYDGNTVTGLWNYAQHYAMSDNSFGTEYGPSTPGALNLVAGNAGNVDMAHTANNPSDELVADGNGGYSVIGDPQPYYDDCSVRDAVALNGQNVGDTLNAAGLSWGWFEGGERPSTDFRTAAAAIGNATQPTSQFTPNEFKSYFADPTHRPAHSRNQALCSTVHPVGLALGGTGQYGYKDDYIPHHNPFDYYASTANPHHLTIPTDASGNDTLGGLESIGRDTQSYSGGTPQFDTPNHNYDMSDFDQLVHAISNDQLPPSALPAVSFLKAPGYQDGHAAYSDPADEQAFVTKTINELMRSPDWNSTAVLINYDDSDGWYDHKAPPVLNPSFSPADNLTNTVLSGGTSGQCGTPSQGAPLAGEQGRCGFGPRLPMLLVSPFARSNAIDHHLSDQSSILNLIEYNWRLPGIAGSADQVLSGTDAASGIPFDLAGLFRFHEGRNHRLLLDPTTGQPVRGDQSGGDDGDSDRSDGAGSDGDSNGRD